MNFYAVMVALILAYLLFVAIIIHLVKKHDKKKREAAYNQHVNEALTLIR